MPVKPPETPSETRQLDHIDEMCHRMCQFIDRVEPLVERAEKFFKNPVAAYLSSQHRPKPPGSKNG
jgi:hypothetical protein